MKKFYVYIMCSKKNGTLYIGVTSNLNRRVYEHKNKILSGFTEKYSITILVYFEIFNMSIDAIKREKQLKKYSRLEKLQLIEKHNPSWQDLYDINILF